MASVDVKSASGGMKEVQPVVKKRIRNKTKSKLRTRASKDAKVAEFKSTANSVQDVKSKTLTSNPLPSLNGLYGPSCARALREHQKAGVALSGFQRWTIYWRGFDPFVGLLEGAGDTWTDDDYGAWVDQAEAQNG